MASNKEFLESILQKLDFVKPIITKNMFGTIALISNDYYFGSIAKGTFYLKVDDSTRSDYVEYGMGPYNTKKQTLDYYQVPPVILEDKNLFLIWVTKALKAAKGKKH